MMAAADETTSSTWSDTANTVREEEPPPQPPQEGDVAAAVPPSSRSPVALITAGSAGVGAATARLLARRGYRVVINFSHNTERARKVVGELQQLSCLPAHEIQNEHGNAFLAIRADLGRRDEIGRLVRETVVQMGRLDVVFSNGGWTKFRDMTSIDGRSRKGRGLVGCIRGIMSRLYHDSPN